MVMGLWMMRLASKELTIKDIDIFAGLLNLELSEFNIGWQIAIFWL